MKTEINNAVGYKEVSKTVMVPKVVTSQEKVITKRIVADLKLDEAQVILADLKRARNYVCFGERTKKFIELLSNRINQA